MKKTVGELVYEKAIQDGYDPALADRAASPLGKFLEKTLDDVKKPLPKIIEPDDSEDESEGRYSTIMGYRFPVITADDYVKKPTVQDVRIVNPAKKESDVVVASYLLPQNANWENLDMEFVDGHIVRVSYPGMKSQKFDYKEMGFMDAKKNKPNLKWELLRVIAEQGGALTNATWYGKFGRNVKYELNERLKEFFGMKSNPIPHYTKKKGYEVLFSLRAEK